MILNDFLKLLDSGELDPRNRIIALSNQKDFRDVCLHYKESSENEIVDFSEFVSENNFYPSAQLVFGRMENKVEEINKENKAAVVIGADIYCSLLVDKQQEIVFAKLKRYIDEERFGVSFIAFEKNLGTIDSTLFRNPKYTNGYMFVKICNSTQTTESPPILYLVSSDWFKVIPPDVNSFGEYIKKTVDGSIVSPKIKIAVQAKDKIAGVKDEVKQILNLRDYLREFHEINDDNLSEEALNLIYEAVKGLNYFPALKKFKELFHKENLLQTFYHKSQTEKEISIFLMKKFAHADTFLGCLSKLSNFTSENFLEMFVCVPKEILENENSKKFAEERRLELLKLGDQNWEDKLTVFIERTRELPNKNVVVWLNNSTTKEKIELLRRYSPSFYGDRKEIEELYPAIKDYLSHHLPSKINAYFETYKKCKIQGEVTQTFIESAEFTKEIPMSIKSRDSLVQKYCEDENIGLLLVDGMGAEYFDMIVSLANRKGMKIVLKEIGYAKLPSSTNFNKIEWEEKRKLPEIKQLDNICHHGTELYVTKTHEENVVAEFDVISKDVFIKIREGLERFERVLLTADHGSSRLALCAYNQGLAKTIEMPSDCAIADWRYMKKPKNVEARPPELIETLDGKYWVVRRYDRLSKQGGKEFGLHGGATWEEMLVPVIVFGRGYTNFVEEIEEMYKTEFVEKDEFADL
jgi:hypothetical protein